LKESVCLAFLQIKIYVLMEGQEISI